MGTIEPAQLFAAARDHVADARRGEGALERLLVSGRLDTLDRTRPYPEHDRDLARAIVRDTTESLARAAACLLEAVLR